MTVEDVARDEGGVELEGGHALLQPQPHLPSVRPTELLQSSGENILSIILKLGYITGFFHLCGCKIIEKVHFSLSTNQLTGREAPGGQFLEHRALTKAKY